MQLQLSWCCSLKHMKKRTKRRRTRKTRRTGGERRRSGTDHEDEPEREDEHPAHDPPWRPASKHFSDIACSKMLDWVTISISSHDAVHCIIVVVNFQTAMQHDTGKEGSWRWHSNRCLAHITCRVSAKGESLRGWHRPGRETLPHAPRFCASRLKKRMKIQQQPPALSRTVQHFH